MYSQEGLNPDPPIPLLPVSRTENLYGMCCHAQLSCRVRGGITALGWCSFLQPSSFLLIMLPSSSQTRAPTWRISAPLFLCLPEGRNSRLGGEPELLVPCYIRVIPVYFHTCLSYRVCPWLSILFCQWLCRSISQDSPSSGFDRQEALLPFAGLRWGGLLWHHINSLWYRGNTLR